MKKILLFIVLCLSIFISSKVLAYQEYKIGDVVEFRGKSYHVIDNSDSSQNYVTLLRDDNLSMNDLILYSPMNYSHSSSVSFCRENEKCDYDNSNAKNVVDIWLNSTFLDHELVNINGYKGRLIYLDELVNNLGYKEELENDAIAYSNEEVPNWVYNADNYWIMDKTSGSDNFRYKVASDLVSVYEATVAYLRPVINLNKAVLEDDESTDVIYDEYHVGDKVFYNGLLYYVIKNSDKKTDYLTLLSATALDKDTINKFNENTYESEDGEMLFYRSDICNSSSGKEGCYNDYNSSLVKITLDNWAKDFENDLVEIDGNKVRLLQVSDLFINLKYNAIRIEEGELQNLYKSNIILDKIVSTGQNYWLMTPNNLSKSEVFAMSGTGLLYSLGFSYNYYGLYGHIPYLLPSSLVYNTMMVRPVINLKKQALEKVDKYSEGCYTTIKKKAYKDFKIGDEVYIKNEKYYVIENSNKTFKYVTLFKEEPLTYDDVINYGFENSSVFELENRNGIAYFKRLTWYNYVFDELKSLLEKWQDDKFEVDDLMEIGGYKSRFISEDDLLFNLHFEHVPLNTSYHYIYTEETPRFMYDSEYAFYTMTSYLYRGDSAPTSDPFATIRPVINLNKCVLEDGCKEVEETINTCQDDSIIESKVVDVDKTSKNISIIIYITSGLLILSGIIFVVNNYYFSKKEKK